MSGDAMQGAGAQTPQPSGNLSTLATPSQAQPYTFGGQPSGTPQASGNLQTQGLVNAQPQTPWYNDFIHGGGNTKLSSSDALEVANISRAMQDPNLDPNVLKALQERQSEIVNRDNGGYLGSLARMATGKGQTTGENVGGAMLGLGMAALKRYMENQALQQSTQNMIGAQSAMANFQRQNLGRGRFG